MFKIQVQVVHIACYIVVSMLSAILYIIRKIWRIQKVFFKIFTHNDADDISSAEGSEKPKVNELRLNWDVVYLCIRPQSIQSARLWVQSSELGPPPPHPQASAAPPLLGPRGETHSLAGEGVLWPSIPTKGQTLGYFIFLLRYGR